MSYPGEWTLRRAIAFVATLGVAVATYIAITEASGDSPVCLAGSTGCRTVAESSYSHVAGINIAVFGIVGYVMLLASAFFANDAARFGGFVVSLGGFGYSIFLTYIEIFKIEAICQWCVASAVLMTILFGLNAIRLIGYGGTDGTNVYGGANEREA
ncbi:MAG TPA: vitamin K epoxide reductase family protein [Solirubrobacterales bacterium]|nr:vitamin K epoxide reductase family protein [Solirubrobacterales bacterium]